MTGNVAVNLDRIRELTLLKNQYISAAPDSEAEHKILQYLGENVISTLEYIILRTMIEECGSQDKLAKLIKAQIALHPHSKRKIESTT